MALVSNSAQCCLTLFISLVSVGDLGSKNHILKHLAKDVSTPSGNNPKTANFCSMQYLKSVRFEGTVVSMWGRMAVLYLLYSWKKR